MVVIVVPPVSDASSPAAVQFSLTADFRGTTNFVVQSTHCSTTMTAVTVVTVVATVALH